MPGWLKGMIGTALGVLTTGMLAAVAFIAVEGYEHDHDTQPKLTRLAATMICVECDKECMAGCMAGGGNDDAFCRQWCAQQCRVKCGG